MEKIQQSWGRWYKPLKLFKEDVEEILNIVENEFVKSDGKKDWFNTVDIQLGEFKLDRADELGQISEDIVEKLRVSVGGNRLRLNLTEIACLEIRDRTDTKAMGVANRIDGIVRKRQRVFGFLSTPFGIGLILVGPLLLWMCLTFLSGNLNTTTWILLSVPILGIWIGGQWYYYYREKHFVAIYMFYSHAKPSFFKRNKDTLLLNSIKALIAFLLGILGTLFVQWIINRPNP